MMEMRSMTIWIDLLIGFSPWILLLGEIYLGKRVYTPLATDSSSIKEWHNYVWWPLPLSNPWMRLTPLAQKVREHHTSRPGPSLRTLASGNAVR
jgi:hypothetical protein